MTGRSNSLALTAMTAIANRRAETLGLIDRKRLELARALATGPAVLLLDEIGGGLTDAEANELVDIILELERPRDRDRLDRAHRAYPAQGGRAPRMHGRGAQSSPTGAPESVMADPRVIEAYLGGGVV